MDAHRGATGHTFPTKERTSPIRSRVSSRWRAVVVLPSQSAPSRTQNESAIENDSTASLEPGGRVFLFLQGRQVGTANLQVPISNQDSGTFRRSLHGYKFEESETQGHHWVAIHKVNILSACKSVAYPYRYRGIEPPPENLGGMTGIHCWNAYEMKPYVAGPRRGQISPDTEPASITNPAEALRMKELGISADMLERSAVIAQEATCSLPTYVIRNNKLQLELDRDGERDDDSGDGDDDGNGGGDSREVEGDCSDAQNLEGVRHDDGQNVDNIRRERDAADDSVHGEGALHEKEVEKGQHVGEPEDNGGECAIPQYAGENSPHPVEHNSDDNAEDNCGDLDDQGGESESESDSDSDADYGEEISRGIIVRDREGSSIEQSAQGSVPGTSRVYEGNAGNDSVTRPGCGKRKRRYESQYRMKRKGEESALTKKRKKAVQDLDKPDLDKTFCCKTRRCFSQADIVFLRSEASRVLLLSKPLRRSYLEGLHEKNSNLFFFSGKPVCYRFLECAFGFSRDLQGTVKGNKGSCRPISIKGVAKDSSASQRDSVICFMERLVDSTADMMPDTNEKHLPYFQKSAVYDLFCAEFAKLEKDKTPPTQSYFLITWGKYCSNVKIRKVQRFTKCTECEYERDALAKAGTDISVTEPIRERRRNHLEMVAKERREYQKKCELAALYPSKFTSIIIDGADQSAFGLPHFTVNTKATIGRAMKAKLVGVLEHGVSQHLSLFTMTAEFETGANHIIEALHRTLSVKATLKPLQGTLYIQVDNCTRENKNTFMFSYVECLVAWGVFTEVHVSFLPIGHTHADIDQTFSCTSRRLRNTEAITMTDLMQQLRKSYTPEPSVSRMLHLINFSGLCKQEGCIGKVAPFSHFRFFKFHRREGEATCGRASYNTACSVKVECNDQWLPLETKQEGLFGFLLYTPDLSKTPATPAKSPPDLKDINDRFRSEETRINSHKKLQELYGLRDHVYRDREERFHWNLSESFELKGMYRNKDILPVALLAGNEEDEEDCVEEDAPRSDLMYTANHFVAVNGEECTESMPFWLGQILDVFKNVDGVTVSLSVRWYEVYDHKDAWTGKYRAATNQRSKKAWTGTIPVDSIMAEFSSLTKKRIGSAAEKEIIAGLSAIGRRVIR